MLVPWMVMGDGLTWGKKFTGLSILVIICNLEVTVFTIRNT